MRGVFVMGTYIVGAIVLALFGLGVQRIYKNFKSGTSDCCGTGGCSSGCSGCHCAKIK